MTSNFTAEIDPINGVKAGVLATVLFYNVERTRLIGNASNATTGTSLNEALSKSFKSIFNINLRIDSDRLILGYIRNIRTD